MRIWDLYHEGLRDLDKTERLRRPVVPPDCRHNGQSYYVLIPDADRRPAVLRQLAERGIQATFHYTPLHSSPAGRRFGRTQGALTVTEDASARLIRLPLWFGMTDTMIGQVVEAVVGAC
jgi:dTDP-4-amino-4,6-dideoxygalactose transaminase